MSRNTTPSPAGPVTDRLLTKKACADRLGISPRSFERIVARRDIPEPIVIGVGAKRWRESWITAYIAQREKRQG